MAVLAVLGIGYLSAPADHGTAALDPTHRAVTEFTSVVSTFPLDGRISAALRGQPARPTSGEGEPTPVTLPAKQLSGPKATKLLVQAGQVGDELTYSATQIVSLTRDAERITNVVRVASGGSGTALSPAGSGHHPAGADLHRVRLVDRMADADLIDPSPPATRCGGGRPSGPRPHRLRDRSRGADGPVAEGRSQRGGPMVARRQDRAAALAGDVRRSRQGRRGRPTHRSQFGNGSDQNSVVASPAARTTATLTLSKAAQLRRDGWVCADRLAGLSLLRLRTDQTDDPTLVHLVYSDGLTTLSVVEQRGQLSGAPTGSTHNETLGAWVTTGMPTTATWTSGDVVMTAVTDGSRETLAAAVAALPHEARQQPTTMERVRAGWSRILGR